MPDRKQDWRCVQREGGQHIPHTMMCVIGGVNQQGQAGLCWEAQCRAHYECAASGESGGAGRRVGGKAALSPRQRSIRAKGYTLWGCMPTKKRSECPKVVPTPINCSTLVPCIITPSKLRSPAPPDPDRRAEPPGQTAGGATAAWPPRSFKSPSALRKLCRGPR